MNCAEDTGHLQRKITVERRMCLLLIFVSSGSGEAASSQLAWRHWFSTPLKCKPDFDSMADSVSPRELTPFPLLSLEGASAHTP